MEKVMLSDQVVYAVFYLYDELQWYGRYALKDIFIINSGEHDSHKTIMSFTMAVSSKWMVILMPTLPGHMNLPPFFSGVLVTRSLCVYFVDRCLSFCTFSFDHCVVCSSSTYVFWLPLWYLQILLSKNRKYKREKTQHISSFASYFKALCPTLFISQ